MRTRFSFAVYLLKLKRAERGYGERAVKVLGEVHSAALVWVEKAVGMPRGARSYTFNSFRA